VYMRDLGSAEYERMWPYYVVTRERVIKLACLFDLFGLPDCAAELLQTRRAIVGPACDPLLDDLAPADGGRPGAYAEFIRAFEANPGMLYPSRRPETPELSVAKSAPVPLHPVPVEQARPEETVTESPASTADQEAELLVLRERVARLKDKARLLQDRLRRRNEEIAKLRKTNDAREVRS